MTTSPHNIGIVRKRGAMYVGFGGVFTGARVSLPQIFKISNNIEISILKKKSYLKSDISKKYESIRTQT